MSIMKDPYVECPVIETESFIIRLVKLEDSADLFKCYHDEEAVALMNADNCDFGFYMDTPEKMEETVKYWLNFYKKRCFIRFSVVERSANMVVGSIEGFGGDVGVLRLDIRSDYEKYEYLKELCNFAVKDFHDIFGNEKLVIKAVETAEERRRALVDTGWEFIDLFRSYKDYYEKSLNIDAGIL